MKKIVYATMIGIILISSGCSQKDKAKQVNTMEETLMSESNKETLSEQITKAGSNQSKAESVTGTEIFESRSKSDTKLYYGSWNITSSVGTSAVYALSQQEIDDLIGAKITFQSDSYSFREESMNIQGYSEETETADMFQEYFGIPFTNLGITDKEVTKIEVLAEGDIFGGYFLIKDENHLILYYEGVFFEAVRE